MYWEILIILSTFAVFGESFQIYDTTLSDYMVSFYISIYIIVNIVGLYIYYFVIINIHLPTFFPSDFLHILSRHNINFKCLYGYM